MLLKLPTEVIIGVLEHLDYRAILQCRLVRRSVKDLVDNVTSLQLSIELAKAGLTFDTDEPHSCGDVLQRLRESEERWRNLCWKDESACAIKGHCNAYELVDGLFVKTDTEGYILIQDLPTTTNPVHKIVTDHQLAIKPGDFALDPTQDLIVFLKIENEPGPPQNSNQPKVSIRVASLSTLHPHPEAAHHLFYFDINAEAIWGNGIHRAVTQIAGDVVGTLICSGGTARLTIWNWKTGKRIGDSKETPMAPAAYGFSFVSPSLFYITTTEDDGVLALYSFDSSGETTGFVHIASLFLPPTNRDFSAIHTFSCHTEAFLSKPSSKSFSTLLEKQIHVFTIAYIDLIDLNHSHYRMFAPASVFLHYLRRYLRQSFPRPIFAEWNEWGPLKTRFMPSSGLYNWLRYVHGQRVVSPSNDGFLQVFDFNVHHSEIQIALPLQSVIIPGRTFCDFVASGLPYKVVRRPISEVYDGYMIDHERIVALSVEGPNGQTINKLTVLTF